MNQTEIHNENAVSNGPVPKFRKPSLMPKLRELLTRVSPNKHLRESIFPKFSLNTEQIKYKERPHISLLCPDDGLIKLPKIKVFTSTPALGTTNSKTSRIETDMNDATANLKESVGPRALPESGLILNARPRRQTKSVRPRQRLEPITSSELASVFN